MTLREAAEQRAPEQRGWAPRNSARFHAHQKQNKKSFQSESSPTNQLATANGLALQPNRCWQGRRLLLWPPLHNPPTDRVLCALISILAPRFFSFRVFHASLWSLEQWNILNFDQNILKNKVNLVEICSSK